jgi:hypothetical protein
MNDAPMELIRRRRSVRTYDGEPLAPDVREALLRALDAVRNPFGVPVTFRLLDAADHGLSSPVIVGEKTYLAAKARRQPHCEAALGCSFELACLRALELGLGTVMLAGTLSRSACERAMDLDPEEIMPVASPVGRPARKPSVRETLMRKGARSDERQPFETLFYAGSFDRPLTPEAAGPLAEALEAVRLAPSAANRQPWRAVIGDGLVHFYKKRSMKDSPRWDLQRLDLGIALAHFDLILPPADPAASLRFADPGLPCPDRVEYCFTRVL